MNINIMIKCRVCGCVIRVSEVAGFLDSHPIRIHCPSCDTLIQGKASTTNQEEISCNVVFNNAEIVDEEPEYFIRTSGELITRKIEKHDSSDESQRITPFFLSLQMMGHDAFDEFKSNYLQLEFTANNEWPQIMAIFELWHKKKYELLKGQLSNILPEKRYPLDNKLELSRGVHFVLLHVFQLLYDKEFFKESSGTIPKKLMEINPEKLDNMIRFFKEKDIFRKYQYKIYKILGDFVRNFKFLIPAYSVVYSREKFDFTNYGTTASSFSDVKQLYLDLYETIGELLILPISLNNLLYREDFEKIDIDYNKNKGIRTTHDLFQKSKGERLKYFNEKEYFNEVISLQLNNKLRNAIGHNQYEYIGVEQKILYWHNAKKEGEPYSIYLLEFEHECIKLVKSIVIIEEILYRTRMYEFMLDGYVPTASI